MTREAWIRSGLLNAKKVEPMVFKLTASIMKFASMAIGPPIQRANVVGAPADPECATLGLTLGHRSVSCLLGRRSRLWDLNGSNVKTVASQCRQAISLTIAQEHPKIRKNRTPILHAKILSSNIELVLTLMFRKKIDRFIPGTTIVAMEMFNSKSIVRENRGQGLKGGSQIPVGCIGLRSPCQA